MQKVSPIKQRILQFADTLGISKREFYAKIGVSRGTLESNTGITEDIVAKFIAAFPEINVNWLITGQSDITATNNNSINKPKSGIPLIPIFAMAGKFAGDQQVFEYECERYVIPIFKDADFLIRVEGVSMIPKFNPGDVVACKHLNMNDIFFQWNRVYILDTNQGALIKRIQKGSDNDHILIVSDNQDYEPFELHKSSIYSIAIVMGIIKSE